MSQEAKVAEWMAFLFPFSGASLNRFVIGWLELGTEQGGGLGRGGVGMV